MTVVTYLSRFAIHKAQPEIPLPGRVRQHHLTVALPRWCLQKSPAQELTSPLLAQAAAPAQSQPPKEHLQPAGGSQTGRPELSTTQAPAPPKTADSNPSLRVLPDPTTKIQQPSPSRNLNILSAWPLWLRCSSPNTVKFLHLSPQILPQRNKPLSSQPLPSPISRAQIFLQLSADIGPNQATVT